MRSLATVLSLPYLFLPLSKFPWYFIRSVKAAQASPLSPHFVSRLPYPLLRLPPDSGLKRGSFTRANVARCRFSFTLHTLSNLGLAHPCHTILDDNRRDLLVSHHFALPLRTNTRFSQLLHALGVYKITSTAILLNSLNLF